MVETVFVFGYSGSGKTTATRCVAMLIKETGGRWSTPRFNDYAIMYEWFTNDIKHQWFLPTEHAGFEVLVPEIYDLAIEELTRKICEHKPSEHELMIIDFARWDYSSSLKLLGKDYIASTASILKTMYGVNEQKIWVIDNNTTSQNLYKELENFVDCIKSNHAKEKNAGLSNPTNEPAFI